MLLADWSLGWNLQILEVEDETFLKNYLHPLQTTQQTLQMPFCLPSTGKIHHIFSNRCGRGMRPGAAIGPRQQTCGLSVPDNGVGLGIPAQGSPTELLRQIG